MHPLTYLDRTHLMLQIDIPIAITIVSPGLFYNNHPYAARAYGLTFLATPVAIFSTRTWHPDTRAAAIAANPGVKLVTTITPIPEARISKDTFYRFSIEDIIAALRRAGKNVPSYDAVDITTCCYVKKPDCILASQKSSF